jgi:hypothetical protein
MISHLPPTNGARHSSAVQPCKGLKKSQANHHETARTVPVDTSVLHPHSILQAMASTVVARSHNAGWPNPEGVGVADAVREAEVETGADAARIAGLREDRGGEAEWCIGVEDTVRHEETRVPVGGAQRSEDRGRGFRRSGGSGSGRSAESEDIS